MNAIIQKPGDGVVPAKWLQALAYLLATAAISGFGAGLSAWVTVQRLHDRVSDCRYDLEEFQDKLLELDARSTTNTVNRIRNEAEIARLEQQVHELQTIAAARLDKFTGTMEREMEERIDKRLKQLEAKQP